MFDQESTIINQQFLRTCMLRAVSTYLYVKERLHPGLLDGLVRSGVQAIEIFAARQHLDYANRKAHVKEIAEWFRGSGIPLNSVHSPLYADYEWGRTGAPPVNISGALSEAFEILRGHICSTHVHDNAKDKDSHLWPGQGSIDWKQAMEVLRSAPQPPALLLELEGDEKVNPLEKLGQTFEKLETA